MSENCLDLFFYIKKKKKKKNKPSYLVKKVKELVRYSVEPSGIYPVPLSDAHVS